MAWQAEPKQQGEIGDCRRRQRRSFPKCQSQRPTECASPWAVVVNWCQIHFYPRCEPQFQTSDSMPVPRLRPEIRQLFLVIFRRDVRLLSPAPKSTRINSNNAERTLPSKLFTVRHDYCNIRACLIVEGYMNSLRFDFHWRLVSGRYHFIADLSETPHPFL
jgi:hypothetical protein